MNNKDQKIIAIYTAIKPSKENKNSPGFLISYYIETLKTEYKVHVVEVNATSKTAKLGLYIGNNDIIDADLNIVYPFHLYFKYNWKKAKVLVIGPDSPSLLFTRIASISSGLNFLKNYTLSKYFEYLENILISNNRLVVVGKEDENKICKNSSSPFSKNTKYIPHPFNKCYLGIHSHTKLPRRRLVFAGDLSSKYVGSLTDCINLIHLFNKNDILEDVLFVGNSSRYIFEKMRDENISVDRLRHVQWIEDYSEISMPGRDIHVAPLSAGAGTKNRVLASISLGVPVIGTPIAFENINLDYQNNSSIGLFHFSDVETFLADILNYTAPSNLHDQILILNRKIAQNILHTAKESIEWNS